MELVKSGMRLSPTLYLLGKLTTNRAAIAAAGYSSLRGMGLIRRQSSGLIGSYMDTRFNNDHSS